MEQQMGGIEDNKVGFTNQMQIDLAVMNGQALEAFIEHHAQDFRKVIEENPGLVERYLKDKNAVLSELQSILYH